jgi:hypothetical protein
MSTESVANEGGDLTMAASVEIRGVVNAIGEGLGQDGAQKK